MDVPAARVTSQFLVDKPLDARMYTTLRVDFYASVHKMAKGIYLLVKAVYVFEGDFLKLSPAMLPSRCCSPRNRSTCDKWHEQDGLNFPSSGGSDSRSRCGGGGEFVRRRRIRNYAGHLRHASRKAGGRIHPRVS